MLVQKKDTELKIIEGLHSNDLDQEVHNIHRSQTDKPTNPGTCHTCNGPHFIKVCDDTICLKYKPNLNNHILSKCPRRHPSNWPFIHNTLHNNTIRNTHETNSNAEPKLQLLVSTNKAEQMAELLEATKQMTKFFKRSLKHTPKHDNNNNHYEDKTNISHSDKYKHKHCYHKDEVNKITSYTSIPAKWLSKEHEVVEVKLSNVNMLLTSQLTTIRQSHYSIQVQQSLVCQNHISTSWTLNPH